LELLVSPMFRVPTVREVVSMVTVRVAVEISSVSPTVEAAPPGTVGLLDQLVARLQFPLAFTTHVPSAACSDCPAKGKAATATIKAAFLRLINFAARRPVFLTRNEDSTTETEVFFMGWWALESGVEKGGRLSRDDCYADFLDIC